MSYFNVDPCDTTCYIDTKLPTLPEGIMLVQAFTPEQAKKLLDILTGLGSKFSGLHADDGSEKIDKGMRSSEFMNVPKSLYDEVDQVIAHTIDYHLTPLIGKLARCEPLSFLKYTAENSGHFNRHTDSGYFGASGFIHSAPKRKITTLTYLNEDYTGGELMLDTVNTSTQKGVQLKLPVGTMLIMPADIRFPHEVTPVKTGERYSIVGWYDYA